MTCNRMVRPRPSSSLFPIILYHCKIYCNLTTYREKLKNKSKKQAGKAHIQKTLRKLLQVLMSLSYRPWAQIFLARNYRIAIWNRIPSSLKRIRFTEARRKNWTEMSKSVFNLLRLSQSRPEKRCFY